MCGLTWLNGKVRWIIPLVLEQGCVESFGHAEFLNQVLCHTVQGALLREPYSNTNGSFVFCIF